MTGFPMRTTVTVKLHVAALPWASVAVQVTTLLPTGKKEPEGGEEVTEAMVPQLLVTVGAGYVTMTPPEQVLVTMLDGQAMAMQLLQQAEPVISVRRPVTLWL